MKIGLDMMGGDFAPASTVGGVLLAMQELNAHHTLVLIGDTRKFKPLLEKNNRVSREYELVHTTQSIEMGDNPAKAFAQKTDSSIAVGYRLLQQGKLDGFASAGSTGAMLVGAHYSVKTIEGIIRPAIATTLPSLDGQGNIILDIGINPDCRPDILYQYGILGSLYARHVCGFTNPRVGLLNIGAEETKGNLLTRSAYELMSGNKEFNFAGNVEGNDLFSNAKVDVVVADGFVGNVVLKEAETFFTIARKLGIQHDFIEKFNFENYGGTPILGINAPVVIGHGISNDVAIKNMILQTVYVIEAKLTERIKEAFK
jgi:phosphate acyltransferase